MEENDMAKKLMINCATCDARRAKEENYAHYESITINCASVLTSPEGKALMNRLPFTLNCANVIEVDEDVDFRTVNGSTEIKSGDVIPENRFYMLVNGSLTIGPDTKKQLEKCAGMTINGSLTCPESIYAGLTGVNVNGSSTCYPDNAVILKRTAVIDRLFTLRAKNRLYWSGRRMIMTDSQLNPELLRNKGASFSSKEMIISESKVEAMLDLIDEKAEIIIVPDGTSVVQDDVTLDETALRRYGNKIYVIGDVIVPENAEVLDKLEYLNVCGDARVLQEHKEKFLDILTEISGEIKIVTPTGLTLEDKPFVKITKWMLEQQPSGINISDCAVVSIAGDIPKNMVVERLQIEDCGIVRCTEEQEDAIAMICKDVQKISTADGKEEVGLGSSLKAALGGIKGALDTKVITAADYVL